jgi:D-aminoacyl-tRNA deacylase
MKLVIQRVSRALVRVEGQTVSSIGTGFLVLVGLERGDGTEQVERAAAKVASLRAFEDGNGRLNRSLEEVGGAVLAVSQFTLAGSIRRGRRPSFDRALAGEEAQPLFDLFVARLRESGLTVGTGEFGAMMEVELVNHGPVTLLWDDPPTGG